MRLRLSEVALVTPVRTAVTICSSQREIVVARVRSSGVPHSAFNVGRYVAVSRPGAPLDLSVACDGSVSMDSITLCGSVCIRTCR